MEELAIDGCLLQIESSSDNNVPLKWDSESSSRRVAYIDILQGKLTVGGVSKPCRVIKVNSSSMQHDLCAQLVFRFKNSMALPQNLFNRGLVHFNLNGFLYLCYDHYDCNLMDYIFDMHDPVEITRVVRGFFEAVCYLHRQGIHHGHLHYINLVVANGIGYLSGGTGDRIIQYEFDHEKNMIFDEDHLKYDLLSISEAIFQCFKQNNRKFTAEVKDLLTFLNTHKTIDTVLFHPFLLTPRMRKEFCITFFTLHTHISSGGSNFKTVVKALDYPRNHMIWNGEHNTTWWSAAKNTMLSTVLTNGSYKGDSLHQFFKFTRDSWVHAMVDATKTSEEFYQSLQKELDKLWPNILLRVHEVIYIHRSSLSSVNNYFI